MRCFLDKTVDSLEVGANNIKQQQHNTRNRRILDAKERISLVALFNVISWEPNRITESNATHRHVSGDRPEPFTCIIVNECLSRKKMLLCYV